MGGCEVRFTMMAGANVPSTCRVPMSEEFPVSARGKWGSRTVGRWDEAGCGGARDGFTPTPC